MKVWKYRVGNELFTRRQLREIGYRTIGMDSRQNDLYIWKKGTVKSDLVRKAALGQWADHGQRFA